MFWLFWQLVGIVIALLIIGVVVAMVVGFFGFCGVVLSAIFKPSHSPVSSKTPGWVSVKCKKCGRQYEGVNDFEARKTLAWHMKTQHGVDVPSRFKSDVLLGQIVDDKPVSKRRIYFAKCPFCDARFESFIADVARTKRENHIDALHGLDGAVRPSAQI